jgi:hypothetical protein
VILFLLIAILPHDTAARNTFDVCEVQDVWQWSCVEQENGDTDYVLKPVFCQLLFRRWDERTEQHVIEAWRMAKPNMAYQFSHAKQRHEIRWYDGDLERVVEVKSMRYSSSDFDSELRERETHPKEHRTDLKGRK